MNKNNKIILLVDPETNGYLSELLLSLDNFQIIVKNNHKDAFEFFIYNHFEISIVLLHHMPDFSCLDLLRYMKLVEPSIPVIVLTDHGSEEIAASIFRIGANDYLKKSSSLHELHSSIDKLLTHNNNSSYCQKANIHSLYKAIAYINNNYCRNIRLSNVSREAGMSISCFERTFKKNVGMNFSTYINKLRITKAVRMLKETNYSICEIAFACGFTNQFHFSRTFRKIMAISPRIYKKNLHKESTLR